MQASRRCIFFAGAPEADDLKWDDYYLLTDFKVPIRRFLEDEHDPADVELEATPPSTYAKWRYLPYDRQSLRGGTIDQELPNLTQFLSFDIDDRSSGQDDFLERSMALLDDIQPAHIVSRTALEDSDQGLGLETTFVSATSLTTTSFDSTSIGGSFLVSPEKKARHVDISGPVTDLKKIPSAEYILRLQPQTITVNLVVGIISVSPIRTVRLRRRNAEMDIIELTVGDESRAGFSISFWLVPLESQRKPADDLRQTLSELRTGDVIVVNNAALSCFNGCVYGQSLSKRFARNSTCISVVRDGDFDEVRHYGRVKVARVLGWTSDFVGVASNYPSKMPAGVNASESRLMLPPDTQD